MAASKLDRRTQRTRSAIMSAFVELILSRGYEEIGVEDITTRANIGRSTFYMHYKSKLDVLKQSLARPSGVLSIIVGHDVPRDVVMRQLAHFHEQRRVNRVFFSAPIRSVWEQCLAEMIEPRVTKLIRQYHAKPLLPTDVIARQIADAQVALVTNWLVAKPSLAPQNVAEALIATTRAMLAAMLGVAPGTVLFIAGEKLRLIRA